MNREQFFIIGVLKCGTTYLATVLDEHPDICMARPFSPEPKFFIREEEYRRGLEYYERTYYTDTTARLFGEKTAHYCEREDAAVRIRKAYPDCKIIIILRDPVRRAISNYFFSVNSMLETRTPEEALLAAAPEPDRGRAIYISPFAYLERGIYLNHIRLYEKYFDHSRMLVIVMENIIGRADRIQEVYRFLGVDESFMPSSLNVIINAGKEDPRVINPEIVSRLHDHFQEPNRMLAEHTGIDLSVWKC